MKVKEFHGLDGVREITYNTLETHGTFRIYEMVYASLSSMFPEDEARRLRQEFIDRDIFVKELSNAAYKSELGVNDTSWLEVRYVDPKRISYDCETVIYNDKVAFYTYGDDAYGVEIEDTNFASTQRQIFDELWRKAARPVIGRGRSSLF